MMQMDLFRPPTANPMNIGLKPLHFDFGNEMRRQQPLPPSSPVEPAYRIKFVPGTATHDTVINEWKALPSEVRNGRLVLTFSKPIALHYNRSKREVKSVHTFRLFTDKNTGQLCHTLSKRIGWIFDDKALSLLISIEPEPEKDLLSKVKRLANRIHPNAWDDLKAKLLADPNSYLANYGYTVTSITGKFPDYVLEEVRRAFEVKSNYSYDAGMPWTKRKTGRDLKVECKLCDDGIFRAWFSSEYPGCANGDYWILLNPTTAAFKDND
jgi:hypothetical protein